MKTFELLSDQERVKAVESAVNVFAEVRKVRPSDKGDRYFMLIDLVRYVMHLAERDGILSMSIALQAIESFVEDQEINKNYAMRPIVDLALSLDIKNDDYHESRVFSTDVQQISLMPHKSSVKPASAARKAES